MGAFSKFFEICTLFSPVFARLCQLIIKIWAFFSFIREFVPLLILLYLCFLRKKGTKIRKRQESAQNDEKRQENRGFLPF